MIKKIIYITIIFAVVIMATVTSEKSGNRDMNIRSKDFVLRRISGETLSLPVPGQKKIIIFWNTSGVLGKFYVNKFNQMLTKGLVSAQDVIAVNEGNDFKEIETYLIDNKVQLIVAKNENNEILIPNAEQNPTLLFINENLEIVYESSFPNTSIEKKVEHFLGKNAAH